VANEDTRPRAVRQERPGSRPRRQAVRAGRRVTAGVLAGALALALGSLTMPALAWRLPWHHRAHPRVQAGATGVAALAIQVRGAPATAGTVPQSWDRNTLIVDLTRLGGEGSATLTPPANTGWPARLAFRVQPGSMASLQVQGAQRVQFTLPAHGAVMTLPLDPGVYVVKTASLTLQWSAADGLPH